MANGTQTFMFSFGPLSGLADIAAGLPGTEVPAVFNTVYGGTFMPGDPANSDGWSTDPTVATHEPCLDSPSTALSAWLLIAIASQRTRPRPQGLPPTSFHARIFPSADSTGTSIRARSWTSA